MSLFLLLLQVVMVILMVAGCFRYSGKGAGAGKNGLPWLGLDIYEPI